MNVQFHTKLDLEKLKKAAPVTHGSKEAEPIASPKKEAVKIPEPSEQEKPEAEETDIEAPEEGESPQQIIEERPEEVEVSPELEKIGVQQSPHQTFMAKGKEIHLPIPIEDVDSGLHKPFSSGLRWMAEITMYILSRFHKTIQKIGGALQIVDKP